MTEHPNALLLHHAIQAADAGDTQTLRAIWADDIVWHVKGTGPLQGEIKGVDEVFEYLADLGELGDDGVHTEVEDVLVSHRRAAAICRTQATRGAHSLETSFIVIATIVDRRIQRLVTIPVDADHLESFWSDRDA